MKNVEYKKGFSIIEILLVVAIMAVIVYFATKIYYKKPYVDEKTRKELSQQGIDVNNQKGIIDKSKEKVNEFNKSTEKREEDIKQVE